MWLFLFLMLLPTDPPPAFNRFDPNQYLANPIGGVVSPTALAWYEGRLYLACDVLEAQPGFYRILSQKGALQAGLVRNVPQETIEGLLCTGNTFVLTSSRSYTSDEDSWKGKILTYDAQTRRQTDIIQVDLNAACSDGRFECGIVSAARLDPETWLVATKQNTAEVLVLKQVKGVWTRVQSLPVSLEGKAVSISEFQIIGTDLVFLLRNRWVISSVPIASMFLPNAWQLRTKPVLDLSPLRKAFKVANNELMLEGWAEGFCFDREGRLHVLLNNRGYDYELGTVAVGHNQPYLITYTPSAP